MTDVVSIGRARARRDPKVAEALGALAALDDDMAGALGARRLPDGTLGTDVRREEWEQALRDGEVDPVAFLRNLRLLGWVMSPEFDTMIGGSKS